MPLFQLENEYYNKYSSELEYFQVIGTVTDEEYVSMVEHCNQNLEHRNQNLEHRNKNLEQQLVEEKKERESYIISLFKNIGLVDKVADLLSLSKEYVKKVLLSKGLISLGS